MGYCHGKGAFMDRVKLGSRSALLLVGAGSVLWTAASSAATADGAGMPQLAPGDHCEYRVTDNLRRGAV